MSADCNSDVIDVDADPVPAAGGTSSSSQVHDQSHWLFSCLFQLIPDIKSKPNVEIQS